MKQNERGMIESAKAALLSCLSSVRFLRVIDVQEELDSSDVRVDLVVDIELPDRIVQLVGEIKRSGQPRLAREAVNRILRYKSKIPGAYFVFIAPYISQRAADICRAEGVGYLDLSGNCFLLFDTIFIEKKDYPNQFKEKRDLKSLYASKAERILRVLLCNPGRNWNIKALADDSGPLDSKQITQRDGEERQYAWEAGWCEPRSHTVFLVMACGAFTANVIDGDRPQRYVGLCSACRSLVYCEPLPNLLPIW